MNKILNLLTISLLMSTPAVADSLVIQVGASDVLDEGDALSAVVGIDYHFDPFITHGRLSTGIGIGAQVDDDGDLFLGIGTAATFVLNEKWFIENSFMPGFYDPGSDGTDLGGNIQFRSILGIGYNVSDETAISLAVQHISNASLDSSNPGNEAITLRYFKRF